jgi:hypothetical protein
MPSHHSRGRPIAADIFHEVAKDGESRHDVELFIGVGALNPK